MRFSRFLEKMEKNQDVMKGIGLIGLGLLIIFDTVWVGKEHAHTAAERIPAFWSMFGLVACLVIIIFSKWLGHLGIMKREDFYDD
ncbi:MAG: hypothetical protein JXK94_00555 [Deltaproteobacteria bacterium]|nr:hypothetical protein [Deltaproteobacteria bacterium]